MIRKHENAISFKACALALGVHAALLLAMIISIDWKAAHPVMNVTEVELWDSLPAANIPKPSEQKIAPKPEPQPEVKEEPKPEPKPIVEEKPKEEDTKAEIALEKQKLKEEKAKQLEDAKKEKDNATKKLAAEMREEALREEKAEAKKQADALKKLQNDSLADDKGQSDKHASVANASLIAEYTDKIKAKIRGNVNKTLCSEGNPEVRFEISVLPTGELSGNPKLAKSSGSDTCDEAVERAIMASEPFPLPDEPSARAQFRNLKLKFKPNE